MLSSPTHVYHIKKRGQALLYVKYTQHESIHGGDVKLPLYVSNIFQTNFGNFLKIIFSTK